MHALRAFVALSAALLASAELYVTQPAAGATCHGGQACTVSWVDNGVPPLVSSIGVVRVGLYTGDLQLVQTIVPVDVSKSHSLTFTPSPKAGPNSDAYYVAFISSDGKFYGYTPNFALDGMSGSFSSPDPSATPSIAVPSSLAPTSTTPPSGVSSGPTPSGTASASASGSSSAGASAHSTTGTVTSLPGASSVTSGTGASSLATTGLPSSSGTSTSSATTTFATQATITPSSAAVATGPATGFAWTLLAALGFVLF